MRCECGNEILNVPEHLRNAAKWVCKECGRNVDTVGRRIIPVSNNRNEGLCETEEKRAA